MKTNFTKTINGFALGGIMILGLGLTANGQFQFEEILPEDGADFIGVVFSSVAFSDADGDGDEDLLITGQDITQKYANFYFNEGGVFTLVENTPFVGVSQSTVAFADVDGDGDQDVMICGTTEGNGKSTNLYINDGDGAFTLVENTIFQDTDGDIAFSDVNGDGDLDVMISGRNVDLEPMTNLYVNDGGGTFTLVVNTPFGAVAGGIAFSDIDGDGDEDALITGSNGVEFVSSLYMNNEGNFSLEEDSPFEDVLANEGIAFSDINGDGDDDLVITGASNPYNPFSGLYTNSGGTFTALETSPFMAVLESSVAFADIDGDGDEDVLITGTENANQTGINIELYENNEGFFSLVADMPFEGVKLSSVAFSDIDGDGDQDVLITGGTIIDTQISKLYRNNTPQAPSSIDEVKINTFAISPNPTSGMINIDLSEVPTGLLNFSVLNYQGQIVLKENLMKPNGSLTVDLSAIENGVYVLSIETQTGDRLTSRMLKLN